MAIYHRPKYFFLQPLYKEVKEYYTFEVQRKKFYVYCQVSLSLLSSSAIPNTEPSVHSICCISSRAFSCSFKIFYEPISKVTIFFFTPKNCIRKSKRGGKRFDCMLTVFEVWVIHEHFLPL